MCKTHAKSAAIVSGFIGTQVCGGVARGLSVPKTGDAGTANGTTWADSACLGTCSATAAQFCNANTDCPGAESCNTSCTPVTCAVTPGPPRTDNFCFGTISGSCCNVIPSRCLGDSSDPICRPNLGDPPGLLTASFSRSSAGVIDPGQSSITVTLDDGTTVTPSVSGTLDFTGQPCPGSSCDVGVTLEAFVADFSAKGAAFSKMSISAGTLSPLLNLSGAGAGLSGILDASNLSMTLQGTASAKVIEICVPGTMACASQSVGGTQAIRSQAAPGTAAFAFEVDYVARTFTMRSRNAFVFPRTPSTPGFTASLSFSGTIRNQPPRAIGPASFTVECDSPNSGTATVDGRASTDPDKDLLQWSWLEGREVVGTFVGHEPVVTLNAPFVASAPTTTEYTLQVTDTAQQTDTASFSIEVIDTAPPQLEATVEPSCLWAPNHGLVLLRLGSEISATATDACAATPPTVYIKRVSSNQPDQSAGQGNTTPDFVFGTAAVCLRSEREGTAGARNPRVYTITLAAKDGSGNETTRDITVTVPHDQRGAKCPRLPASLIVPDGDPACSVDLPGIPVPPAVVSDAPPAPVPPANGCTTSLGFLMIWVAPLLLARRRAKS